MPSGDLFQDFAGGLFGVVQEGGHRLDQGLFRILGEEGSDTCLGDVASGELSPHVSYDHVGNADVVAKNLVEGVVGHTGLVELEGRNYQTFLEYLRGVGGDAAGCLTPDILVMGDGAAKYYGLAVVEDGGNDGDVGEVGAASVGVIEDVGVPLLHSLRGVSGGDGLDGGYKATQVNRDRVALGDGVAVDVEDGGGGVEALLNDAGVRAFQECHLHLVRDGLEAMTDDFESDGIDHEATAFAAGFSACLVKAGMTSLPNRSSCSITTA